MNSIKKIILIFLLLVSETIPQATNKVTVTGKIVDAEDGSPLQNVNIFLINTTIGTTSGKDGNFKIDNIPFGSYEIIFSYLGYAIEKKEFYSYKPDNFHFNISLKLKPVNLTQINVTGNIPESWKEDLKIFTRVFIGETDNSKETKILNPEVLSFVRDKNTNILKAYSDSLIILENKALGYRLKIILDSLLYYPNENIKYSYYSKFEELSPLTEEERLTWNENRERTYLNSPRHFFYSLVHKKLEKEFFFLHEGLTNRKISADEFYITCNDDSSIYTFNYMGGLSIKYYLNPLSFINFLYSSVFIDKYGNLLNSVYAIEMSGFWANQRAADLLPYDYIYEGN